MSVGPQAGFGVDKVCRRMVPPHNVLVPDGSLTDIQERKLL